jgi:predicted alpha/beta hydrolase
MVATEPVRESLSVGLARGAAVEVSLFVPAAPRATVICLPALGVVASYYEPLALSLASRRIAVVTADLRGLGRSSVRPRRGVDFGYACLVDDAARVAGCVRQRLPAPLHLLGHSLGGHVGALLAGSRSGAIDGLVLTACGTPYWRRFPLKTGLGIVALAHAVKVLGLALGYVPGHRLGFGGTEAAQLMREWGKLARRGRFVTADLDAEGALGGVRTHTLVVSIEGDWMAPRSAVDHLVRKLRGAPLERVHLASDSADPRSLDHFRWAKFPDAVVDVVDRWIDPATQGVARPFDS